MIDPQGDVKDKIFRQVGKCVCVPWAICGAEVLSSVLPAKCVPLCRVAERHFPSPAWWSSCPFCFDEERSIEL